MENVGGVFFGIAMLLFFYLFFTSRYIPRILSVVGVSASAFWIGLYFSNVVFPEYQPVFQYISWPPMFIVDIATGVWLMVFAVTTDRPAQLAATCQDAKISPKLCAKVWGGRVIVANRR